MQACLVRFVAAAAVVSAALPAAAQDSGAFPPADPSSVVGIIGEVILRSAAGRTIEEVGGPSFNPFGLYEEELLQPVGAFFITVDYTGEAVKEGELSIFPQFNTPFGEFAAGEATPGIIPFALMQQGACHAGFVAGHPAPEAVYAVDMTDQICHAGIVEELVYAQYAAANPTQPQASPEPQPDVVPPQQQGFDPANPSAFDLDVIAWAAYSGAYATVNEDSDFLFMRNGDDQPVRLAIRDALEREGIHGIIFKPPLTDARQAFGCAAPGMTELRMAFTADGAGIILVAASAWRQSVYAYDPEISAELDVRWAHECRTEGPGRTYTGSAP